MLALLKLERHLHIFLIRKESQNKIMPFIPLTSCKRTE